jgi:hypothetical protein
MIVRFRISLEVCRSMLRITITLFPAARPSPTVHGPLAPQQLRTARTETASCRSLRLARREHARRERAISVGRARPVPGDAWPVDLDLVAPGEKEHRGAALLAGHLEQGGGAEPAEAVRASSRHDPHLACAADLRLSVDLDEHLSFDYAQDLITVVVTM